MILLDRFYFCSLDIEALAIESSSSGNSEYMKINSNAEFVYENWFS